MFKSIVTAVTLSLVGCGTALAWTSESEERDKEYYVVKKDLYNQMVDVGRHYQCNLVRGGRDAADNIATNRLGAWHAKWTSQGNSEEIINLIDSNHGDWDWTDIASQWYLDARESTP